MKNRKGSGTMAAAGAIVGLAALGAAGYHLATGGCPLSACGMAKSTAVVTTIANDGGARSLGGGECTMAGEGAGGFAATEAAFFEAGKSAAAEGACEEKSDESGQTKSEGCCPLSGEATVEQTASTAK